MHLRYLIAAYNEADTFQTLVDKFSYLEKKNVSFKVLVLDNASTDNSKTVLAELKNKNPWLDSLHLQEKGLGVAFKAGLQKLETEKLNEDTWICFNAADLPFNFTDYESFLTEREKSPDCDLFVGSKQHPQTVIQRDFKRNVSSAVFYMLRRLILNLKTKDTQGTIFMNARCIPIYKDIKAKDYFFTTELIYRLKNFTQIIEVPVVYEKDLRPSKVNVLVDGYKSLVQLIKLRL